MAIGGAPLAGMVAKNKIPLSALFLGGNSVQNEGATRLAEALRSVAMTGAPESRWTPRMIAVGPSMRTSAPSRRAGRRG